MTTRIGTSRTKSRHIFAISHKKKGKLTVNRVLQSFKQGENVVLKAWPGVQKSIYHQRFHGKAGKVIGKIGKSYKVSINDQGKQKVIVTGAVHLLKSR